MGFAIVAGGNPNMAVPVAGIAAGDIAVGSTVKLMESGTAVEYLVVNQGIPSNSNLYDSSCDGTWLLRNDAYSSAMQFNTSNSNVYASSAINTWLNGTFFNMLGSAEQAVIKQVKMPYVASGAVKSGANGLSVKAFLLGLYETGATGDLADGAKLEYFISGSGSTARARRISKVNGTAVNWYLRTPNTDNSREEWFVETSGTLNYGNSTGERYARPALVLSKTAIFDRDTMILKGAA